MRAPRFSIGTLLAMIAILGVALAALRSPSYLWANVTFTVALLAVTAGVINSVLARSARRAYWLGFSIFGGTYLAICSAPGLHDTVCPRLATEALLDCIYPLVTPQEPAAFVPPQAAAFWNGTVSMIYGAPPASPMPAPAPVAPRPRRHHPRRRCPFLGCLT